MKQLGNAMTSKNPKLRRAGNLKRVAFSVFDQYEMLYLPCEIKFAIWTLF